MRSRIICFLAVVALGASQAHAQYIGNVGLQTTQQSLATTANCTGAAQIFPVQNLGQTQHYVSIITQTQPTQFQAEIDGVDRQGNVYRISDVMENAFTALIAQGQGTITASGYFPIIQVKVTCSPGTATFSLSYSGSQVTFNSNTGSYLSAQIDKVNFSGSAGNVNQTDTFPTPFGSSAGTIFFQYSGPVAGSTLQVQCIGNQFTNPAPIFTVALTNDSLGHFYQVPDAPCPLAKVSYTSGGAATSITTEYILAPLGHFEQRDPCTTSLTKQSFPIQFAGGTTTQVVALAANLSIYVCGYQIGQVAAAGTFTWQYGTGAACAGGTNNLTGAIPLTASQAVSYSGPGYVAKTPPGNALCLVSTGAGNVSGIVTVVQVSP